MVLEGGVVEGQRVVVEEDRAVGGDEVDDAGDGVILEGDEEVADGGVGIGGDVVAEFDGEGAVACGEEAGLGVHWLDELAHGDDFDAGGFEAFADGAGHFDGAGGIPVEA